MTAVLFLLRVVVLVLLWGLVVAAVLAVRSDVFGVRRKAAPSSPAPVARRTERPAPAPPAPRRDRELPRRLVIVEGTRAGETVPLGAAPITIGRAPDSTLVLTDDYVSTRHARLAPDGAGWVLEDLGSTNGTYLERRRVTAPTPVPLGASIRVGKTTMELRR